MPNKDQSDKPDHPMSNVTRETLQKHWRVIKTTKREVDEKNGVYRAARKAAENDGIDLKALALLEQLAKLEDNEADQRLSTMFRYAEAVAVPIGTQFALFDKEPVKEVVEAYHREWAAEEAGIETGKAGGDRNDDNPYAPGSPLHVKWDAGYLKGQAIIASEMAPTKRKRASTKRERREPLAAGEHASGHT